MRIHFLIAVSVLISLSTAAQKPVQGKTETRVIIRDGNSVGAEKPLVIIDGKPGGDLQSISPDKILNIDVLKGASATSLYGDAGKQGVIVITTKSGTSVDTLPADSKKLKRIVTINTIRKSDGINDTTIIRSDSMTVNVDGERIEINGLTLDEYRDRSGGDMEVRILKMGPDGERRAIRVENTRRAFLGVATDKTESGALIKEVMSGSPAEKAGLLVDDRIISVSGQKVDGPESLVQIIGEHKPGEKVLVAWTRGKKNMKSEIVLDQPKSPQIVEGFELPGPPVEAPREFELALPNVHSEGGGNKTMYLFKADLSSPADKPAPKIGLSVQDTEDGKGVQVTGVTADGAAAKAGIQSNDRLMRFNEFAINEVDALREAMERSRDKRSVMVHLQRGGKDIRVELLFPRQLKQADL